MFYLLKMQSTHRMISTPFLSSAGPQEHPDMHLSHTQSELSATELTMHSEYLQKLFSDVKRPAQEQICLPPMETLLSQLQGTCLLKRQHSVLFHRSCPVFSM